MERTILIAEDSEYKAKMVRRVVEKLGFKTVWCETTNESINYIYDSYHQVNPIAGVVADWNMPNVVGGRVYPEAARRLVQAMERVGGPMIPIIVFSSDARPSSVPADELDWVDATYGAEGLMSWLKELK